VDLRYTLSNAAAVTVSIWDTDRLLVKTIVSAGVRNSGLTHELWDGTDAAMRVMPDEAYTFTIEANGEQSVYDPFVFSAGEVMASL
jgi:flagellar hook assembly protein FlgD